MKTFLTAACIAAACCIAGPAAATENNARDYFSAPEGTKLGVFYAANIRAESAYGSGNEIASNLGFRGQAVLMRWVYMDKCFGLLCNLQLMVPAQRLNSDALGLHASGFADSIVGGTLWFENDTQGRNYVGLTNFLFLPTGAKGVGSERWQTNHMLNVTRGFGPAVLEATADLNVYGEQDSAGGTLRKSPYYTLQLHASYDLTPSTYLGARYRYAGGGKEKSGGLTTAGAARNHQLALELGSWLSARDQVLLHYNKDLKVENGLKQDQLWLRFIRVF